MSQAKSWLKGCAIGCAAVLVLGIGSCVGFVIWINQPGELAETGLLVGPDTVGFAEWRLDLNDPGTEQLVLALLDALGRSRDNMSTPLPPMVDGFLKDWQRRRDERKLRQLFPMVAAWSMHRDDARGQDLHQLTVSIESFGNRAVLVDWILGLTLGRSPEVEVVPYQGERIFEVDKKVAFFLRKSDVVVASNLELARRAVDRLRSLESQGPSELGTLLAGLPQQRPFKGAITNHHGELERVLQILAEAKDGEQLPPIDWNEVAWATVAGEFVDGSDFAMSLTLTRRRGAWEQEDVDALLAALRRAFGSAEDRVELASSSTGETLSIELRIVDLLARFESLADRGFAPQGVVTQVEAES